MRDVVGEKAGYSQPRGPWEERHAATRLGAGRAHGRAVSLLSLLLRLMVIGGVAVVMRG